MIQIERIPGVSFFAPPDDHNQLEFEITPEQQRRYELRAYTLANGKRDTKRKGDVSELHVAAQLVSRGFAISKPLGENQRYDLIVDDGMVLHRVQVKTGRIRGDVLKFNCSSSHGHRRTALKTRPYRGQIDFLAVYCPDNRRVYLLPEADLTQSIVHLRLAPPRNNMVKTIRWASHYELA